MGGQWTTVQLVLGLLLGFYNKDQLTITVLDKLYNTKKPRGKNPKK